MILALILYNYKKDCKLKGKENLVVPLHSRLLIYFLTTSQLFIIFILEFMLLFRV